MSSSESKGLRSKRSRILPTLTHELHRLSPPRCVTEVLLIAMHACMLKCGFQCFGQEYPYCVQDVGDGCSKIKYTHPYIETGKVVTLTTLCMKHFLHCYLAVTLQDKRTTLTKDKACDINRLAVFTIDHLAQLNTQIEKYGIDKKKTFSVDQYHTKCIFPTFSESFNICKYINFSEPLTSDYDRICINFNTLCVKFQNSIALPGLHSVRTYVGVKDPNHILQLDSNCLLMIINYMSLDTVCIVSQSCKHINRLARDNSVWEHLCKARKWEFARPQVPAADAKDWYQVYKTAHTSEVRRMKYQRRLPGIMAYCPV